MIWHSCLGQSVESFLSGHITAKVVQVSITVLNLHRNGLTEKELNHSFYNSDFILTNFEDPCPG